MPLNPARFRRPAGVRALALVIAFTTTTSSFAEESTPVGDADKKKACADASLVGQQARTDGKLGQARASFLACAQAACPPLVRKDCETWLSEVEAALPSIVPTAHDEMGADLTDVQLAVDGVVIEKKLDGRAMPLDPGVHEVTFTAATRIAVTQKIVLHEGEKGRVVVVVLQPAAHADTVAPRIEHARSIAPWLLAGVSVVAVSSFAYFGLKGGSAMRGFDDCKPECDPSAVSSARKKLLVADISLGVAIVSGGLAAWLFLSRDPADAHVGSTPMSIGLAPVPGGGLAGLTGAF